MSDKIKTDITIPDQLFGSQTYTVSVTVTNTTTQDLNNLVVAPKVVEGKLRIIEEAPQESETIELEMKKRKILTEMETQVEKAYARHIQRTTSFIAQLNESLDFMVDFYASLFTGIKRPRAYPIWATEALKINEWEDVERLEKDVLCFEKEDSFLKKAFLINKDKLKRCLDQLGEGETESTGFEKGQSLQPADSITIPFTFQAPHLLRPKSSDLQFEITYQREGSPKITTHSLGVKVSFYPSTFAVPTGGMIGAICGYFIRFALLNGEVSTPAFSWLNLAGSLLLGLVVALLTSRKPSTNKAITVEDFWGGFIVGALTGIFSEQMINKLGLLLK